MINPLSYLWNGVCITGYTIMLLTQALSLCMCYVRGLVYFAPLQLLSTVKDGDKYNQAKPRAWKSRRVILSINLT